MKFGIERIYRVLIFSSATLDHFMRVNIFSNKKIKNSNKINNNTAMGILNYKEIKKCEFSKVSKIARL